MGFPGGSDGKESACNAGDLGSIPVLGRSHGEGTATHSKVTEEPVTGRVRIRIPVFTLHFDDFVLNTFCKVDIFNFPPFSVNMQVYTIYI